MKNLLVVIDMQNDFITGPLGNKECKSIVPNVINKINEASQNGCEIVFTLDTHGKNYLSTQEGKKLPVEHCIENTDGWKLVPEIENELSKVISLEKEEDNIYDNYTCFKKNTFGCTELGDFVACGNYDSVTLVGVCTDICVISNALLIKAFSTETEIVIDASCCAGVTLESHKTALEAMKTCQITVIGE